MWMEKKFIFCYRLPQFAAKESVVEMTADDIDNEGKKKLWLFFIYTF